MGSGRDNNGYSRRNPHLAEFVPSVGFVAMRVKAAGSIERWEQRETRSVPANQFAPLCALCIGSAVADAEMARDSSPTDQIT